MEAIRLLVSIVELDRGKRLVEELERHSVRLHFQSVGEGTAPTEMMDIFGLGHNGKDVVFSLATLPSVQRIVQNFEERVSVRYKGILMVLELEAMNRLAMGIVSRGVEDMERDEEMLMRNVHGQSLVMVNVVQGYSDRVMSVAKRAGATGGTIIRGRIIENEWMRELANVMEDEEREMLFIMAPVEVSRRILYEVNAVYGLKSEARGVMWSVPVEKAIKI